MFTRKEKLLLISLAVIQFSHIVDFMLMMPLGPQLMRIFEISPHQFGLLVSAYTFAAGATGLLSAFFIDRFDRKKSLLFFYFGFAIGTLLCAFADNYSTLLMMRTFTGAFGGVLGSLIMAIVSDAINSERRATAMGVVMASFSLASIFGVPFSLFLANHFSWHAPFLFLGGLSTLLLALIYLAVPAMRGHLEHGERQSHTQVITHILTNKSQMISLSFMILLVFGQFSIIPFLSPSLVANAGMPESQLPLIYLVGGICSIISSPLIGRAADKYGKHKVFALSALISILPILAITNLSVTPVAYILLLVAVFFMAMGGRMIPAMAMVTATVTPQRRGSFMSIVASIQQFSSAIASYFAGRIVERSIDGQLIHYSTVGYVAAGFSLLAIAASTKITAIKGG